ncbi:hypothetical protein PHYBLDRAFT_150392 [Phycomyces blakesleeanus NRRL 1555(-)]|uniref:Uncharacterized protein n=1 Tax=Phycomyces blakesleeanus (strain ATCC 8743b / DSM 1359 / FGSC 10004 / NBRC 33097 / NRRL 1555) TaxID=763407 RepID=A0A162TI85_PHYB8|nr:hypothetical protein PHYBLDRAFT_150392 [Phycomyces blakesleeanus NRRL 1555(-)]OAD68802.1 hypothetical protein PHYBLDRAFT_150392 [Phycomyces blakesleeanus NRRL 1555(-)]|eukprot:XP_018286842.1 hypothetical protein PHYBLDRAFT_150392 [Phycomyces blakesleeanus NRRL 1555(-)]
MSSTQRCCAACHMLGHSRSTHKQCLMNPKNISLHIPQKKTNVNEYPAETAALRIRSESVQDQNLDIETLTSISVSELTEFPLANETITEVLEAVMEEEIEETSSNEEDQFYSIVLTVTELIIAKLQADFVQTITVAEQEDLEIEAEA